MRALEKLRDYHSAIGSLSERMNSVIIELEDLAREAEGIYHDTEFNPEQLEKVNERLDQLYKLEQKHRVDTVEELIAVMGSIRDKLTGISSLATDIENLENTIKSKEDALQEQAKALSAKRIAILPEMEKKVAALLMKMGIPEAEVRIDHEIMDEPVLTGTDVFRFMFSANPGVEVQEMAQIASGGELSRLMLAIKSLISEKNMLPTIIFDEIDSGISGDVSGKVGEVMKELAARMQVVAITHLPQIAGKGHHHFRVYKQVSGNSTKTLIEPVDGENRVTEITKMFSGDQQTSAARKAAMEFLQN
jgi:DNA repair protein RecN (Recombination protein N)